MSVPTQRDLEEGAESIMSGMFNVELPAERLKHYEQAHDNHEYKIMLGADGVYHFCLYGQIVDDEDDGGEFPNSWPIRWGVFWGSYCWG